MEKMEASFSYLEVFKWNGMNKWEKTLIHLYYLKISYFYSLKNWEELESERMKLYLMKISLKISKYP